MNIKKNKLLVVEDEIIISKWTKILLEQQNYSVELVYSGEDAVDLIRGEQNDIDLILMDIDLGAGLNGKETALLIRQDKTLPIIFYTNHYKEDVFEDIKMDNQFGYVNKSSNKVFLFKTIDKYLLTNAALLR